MNIVTKYLPSPARVLHRTDGRGNAALKNGEKPIANPFVLLREEFDDWAVLFNPDTGQGFGLNPTGVFVWKLFDGTRSIGEMLQVLRQHALNVPDEAGEHLSAFIEEVTAHELTVYQTDQNHDDSGGQPAAPTAVNGHGFDPLRFVYEAPRLVNLTAGIRAAGTCFFCTDGSAAASGCTNGAGANYGCEFGPSAIRSQQNGADCQAGIYASCDCISYGAYAAGYCSNGTGTYH